MSADCSYEHSSATFSYLLTLPPFQGHSRAGEVPHNHYLILSGSHGKPATSHVTIEGVVTRSCGIVGVVTRSCDTVGVVTRSCGIVGVVIALIGEQCYVSTVL